MAAQNWISLFEYSNKKGVSLSTLRRRIKNHAIPFRLDQGKYYLLDDGQEGEDQSDPQQQLLIPHNQQGSSYSGEASILSSANKLVEELKAAYAKILQEKEEQIGLLREEIGDLKMLVNLLEKQVNSNKETSEKNLSTTFFFPEIDT